MRPLEHLFKLWRCNKCYSPNTNGNDDDKNIFFPFIGHFFFFRGFKIISGLFSYYASFSLHRGTVVKKIRSNICEENQIILKISVLCINLSRTRSRSQTLACLSDNREKPNNKCKNKHVYYLLYRQWYNINSSQ